MLSGLIKRVGFREKVSRDRIRDAGRSSAVHVRGVRGKEKRENMACGFLRPDDPLTGRAQVDLTTVPEKTRSM